MSRRFLFALLLVPVAVVAILLATRQTPDVVSDLARSSSEDAHTAQEAEPVCPDGEDSFELNSDWPAGVGFPIDRLLAETYGPNSEMARNAVKVMQTDHEVRFHYLESGRLVLILRGELRSNGTWVVSNASGCNSVWPKVQGR